MSDQRITQLTELLQGSVAANDPLPIVDVSASETKKVTAKSLVQAGLVLADAGAIDLAKLDQNSTTKLGTAALADNAVTAVKLADDSSVAVTGGAPAADNFSGRGWFDGGTGNLQIYSGGAYAQVVMPTAGIADAAVVNAKLAPLAVTTDKVSPLGTPAYADLSVTTAKLADGAVTATKIAADTITATEIAPGAVNTSELADSAVTVAKLQDINGNVVLGRNSAAGGPVEEVPCTAAGRDLLAGIDNAAQRASLGLGNLALANGTWVDGSSFSGISSGNNTGDQTISLTGVVIGSGTGAITTTFGAGTVDNTALADGSVTTAKLADDAVTGAKLGNNSTVIVAPGAPVGAGAFIGQLQANSTNQYLYYYNGTSWTQTAGFTSLSVNDNTPISWSVAYPTGPNSPELIANLDQQPPNTVWAGPATGTTNVEPTFRLLTGADLPVPTNTDRGGVYPGEGTLVGSDGQIYLAPATDTLLGGLFVNDANLQVDAAGGLQHVNSLLAPGTYTKVVTDARGHVVDSAVLNETDIPSLPADKITSGTFNPALFAGKSITREALANYAITYIQEENPGLVTDHIGCLWLQESSGQLRMWNGNSWYPVGFGRLAQENLRWGGTVNASADQVTIVTQLGAASGLSVGNALPAASDSLSGIYAIVDTAGNAISVTPGISYDVGDWVLCVSQAQGWVKIDAGTGGGGGGATFLGDLFDVTISAPASGQVLTYNNTLNQWQNLTLPVAPLTSVFGRTGVVVATEGDYSLNLLGDVDLTTVPPSDGNILRFNSVAGQWRPVASSSLSVTTTQGDLIQRGATVDQRLPIGTAGQVLTVNAGGTAAAWHTLTAASETAAGIAEIATQAEVDAETDNTRIVTPLRLGNRLKSAATPLATPSTLMARDATGSTAVNVITATAYNLDTLPALP